MLLVPLVRVRAVVIGARRVGGRARLAASFSLASLKRGDGGVTMLATATVSLVCDLADG